MGDINHNSVRATGRDFVVQSGPFAAVVTEVGGGLRSFRWAGRDLIADFPAGSPRPVYRGSVLAPWPNRIADGRYIWAGEERQLALTEPDRRTALHGLICWNTFTPRDVADDAVVLGTTVWPQPGYPHQLDIEVRYALTGQGLSWRVTARNVGDSPAPYGCSVHPYLTAGSGRADDWILELSADVVLLVDAERLLPTRSSPVEDTDLDLRGGRRLQGVRIDHAYTGLPATGSTEARLVGPDGRGVAMSWDPSQLPGVQVHTADRPEPHLDRAGIAVEPMTCPPDAFSTGQAIVALDPGAEHSASWQISPIGD
jgi:aldose 1-epimerase